MAQMRRRGAARGKVMLVAAALVVVVSLVVAAVFVLPSRGGVVVERGGAATTVAATEGVSVATTSAAETPQVFVVHVDGAVAAPGVYELGEGHARVTDAVAAAGGLVEGADTTNVNLAAQVADGQKVHIPREGEQAPVDASSSQTVGDAAGSGSSAAPSGLVNINTASADELDALPGVGPSTAAAIVEEREANGPFSSIEDLVRVSGIGEKKFAKLKGHICV